jgi:hypothetical protein
MITFLSIFKNFSLKNQRKFTFQAPDTFQSDARSITAEKSSNDMFDPNFLAMV